MFRPSDITCTTSDHVLTHFDHFGHFGPNPSTLGNIVSLPNTLSVIMCTGYKHDAVLGLQNT